MPFEEDAETIRTIFSAYDRRDLDALLECFDPDVEFFPLRAATEGAYRGHAGVHRFLEDTFATFDEYRFEGATFRDLGAGGILALTAVHLRGRGSGASIRQSLAMVWQMRDGKALRQKTYPTEAEALADIPSWPGEGSAGWS